MSPSPVSIPSKFWRFSKYLIPLNHSAWNLWGASAPTRLASQQDLLQLFPGEVRSVEFGSDDSWEAFSFRTLLDGRLTMASVPAEPARQQRVLLLAQSSAVGRQSCVIGPEGTLLADQGYFQGGVDPHNQHWLKRWNPVSRRKHWLVDLRFRSHLPKPTRVEGSAALLNNPWCHNYYHWLLEVAPRLMLMRQAGVEADWYVVDCQSGFQKRALKSLGIPLDRCLQPHYGLHLQADQLIRPSHPGLAQWQAMAKTIQQALAINQPNNPSVPAGRRIYISRKAAAHRKITNEVELETCLASFGFEAFSFEHVDFAEQVRLVNSAECIVAVHGAALANLIFAKPETKVIELCPVDRYNTDCFPRMSHKLGLRHLSVMTPSSRFRQNLVVNMGDVNIALEMMGLRQREGRSSQRAKVA